MLVAGCFSLHNVIEWYLTALLETDVVLHNVRELDNPIVVFLEC